MNNSLQFDIKIVQLLSSRLCHDLAGPAGAVHNGMELLQETGGDDGAASALIAASIEQLNSRLGFFRMAFGMGGLSGRKPALTEARDLAAGFLKGGRTRLDWPAEMLAAEDPPAAPIVSGEAIKLLLNMLLFGADCLPRGGTLSVTLAEVEAASIGLAVEAGGSGASVKDEMMAALGLDAHIGDPQNILSAHNVHCFFMRRLAQSFGGDIEVSGGADEVKIAVLLPV